MRPATFPPVRKASIAEAGWRKCKRFSPAIPLWLYNLDHDDFWSIWPEITMTQAGRRSM